MTKLKKLGKWAGAALAVVAVVVAIGVGAASCIYDNEASATYEVPRYEFALLDDEVAGDPELAREAHRLYMSRGCGECHGGDASGQVMIDAPPFLLAPPNITVVMRSLEPSDIHRIVRRGVYPDGRGVFFMPSHEYRRMPDRELALITAHVRSLPESSATQPASEMRVLGKVLSMLGVFEAPMHPALRMDLSAPFEERGEGEVGEYIAAGCTGCHGPRFSGGPIPGAPEEETGIPPNLTPHASGLEGWTLAEFDAAVREGRTPDGGTLDPDFMPSRVYRYLSDDEVAAIYAYLQSVPALEFGNR